MGWLEIIGKFLGLGSTIESIAGSVERAYEKKMAAQTDAEKIDAEKQIAFFQAQMVLATAASQNDKWWSTRELMGKGACLFYLKIAVWDTVFQLGTTEDPGNLVKGISLTIIGFYFGSQVVGDAGAKILAAFGRR